MYSFVFDFLCWAIIFDSSIEQASRICAFWLVSSIHLHFRWLLICKNLLLQIYLLFSVRSISPLFLFSCVSVLLCKSVIFCGCLLSFPLYVYYLCSRFLFSEYQGVCIGHLAHRLNSLFLLIAIFLNFLSSLFTFSL